MTAWCRAPVPPGVHAARAAPVSFARLRLPQENSSVRVVLESRPDVTRLMVMVQKEVGEKIVAEVIKDMVGVS